MKKWQRVAMWLVLLLLLTTAASACGGKEPVLEEEGGTGEEPTDSESTETETETEAESGDERQGGTVTVGLHQEPNILWGPATGLTVSQETGLLLNAPLLKINDKLEYVPELITEVPSQENGGISEDGLRYTFHLRDDVTWHDGTPFTSKDVKFTYETLIHPDMPVRGRVGWNEIVSVETPDDHTIIFHFGTVDAAFLDRLAIVTMLPEHVLGEVPPAELTTHEWFKSNNPGLGPFRFVEWQPGNYILAERNPNYYKDGLPHLDQIVLKIIADANTLTNQLETGEVHMRFRMLNDQVPIIKKIPHVELISTSATSPWLIWLNNQDPRLAEQNVRLALNYGFDRQGLTQELLQGLVEPAYDLIPPSSWAYDEEAVLEYEYDPQKAKQLLDEAGWVAGADGIREKDGQRLSFELMNIAGEPERVQILSFVQDQWKEIGIEINIKNVDVATMWGNALPKNEYEMAYSYSGRYVDPADLAQHYLCPENDPTTNWGRYCNPELDEVLLAAHSVVDREARMEAYSQALKLTTEDPAYVFLAWRTDHTPINKQVQDYKPAPGYLEMWNAEEWWLSE